MSVLSGETEHRASSCYQIEEMKGIPPRDRIESIAITLDFSKYATDFNVVLANIRSIFLWKKIRQTSVRATLWQFITTAYDPV